MYSVCLCLVASASSLNDIAFLINKKKTRRKRKFSC